MHMIYLLFKQILYNHNLFNFLNIWEMVFNKENYQIKANSIGFLSRFRAS